jgi:surface-anchored protein
MKRQHFFCLRNALLLGLLLAATGFAEGYCVLSKSGIVTLYFGVETELPDPAHPVTMPQSHTDIEIPLRFFDWDIHLRSDLAGRVSPEEGLFALGESHRRSLSAVPASLAFLGVSPGQTFWYYSASYAPSPGFDSQDMTGAEVSYLCPWDPNDAAHHADTMGRWLKVQLVDVRGPENGNLSMWQESTTKPVVFFSTCDGGIDDEDVYYIPANVHSHNSWAFTEPGLYAVDLQVSTRYVCDGSLTADLNNDCFVDLQDYAVISRYWLRDDCGDPNACGDLGLSDPNEIDLEDLNEVTEQWLLCGSPFDSECP